MIDNEIDLFGIASVDRFYQAPKGFHPKDIYAKTRSVFVFAMRLPSESLFADNPIPFTHMNAMAMQKRDIILKNVLSAGKSVHMPGV